MSAEALLALRGVRFRYGEREVLTVEELDLRAGEATVLVGDNGSGKTTLLKLLNGLLAPSAGEVFYQGRPLGAGGDEAIRRDSVLVHQDPYLFRGSVHHNVAFGLKVRHVAAAETRGRVQEALARVGLKGFERRRAGELSGGEGKRVALARALALRPRVLFLDEPTASVDADTVRRIENLLRELVQGGTTLVLSSHHDGFAYRVADRLVRLETGRTAPGRENLLKGTLEGMDGSFCRFRTGTAVLLAPAREGAFTTAVVPLEDVLLSREPLASSARNRFQGRVTALRHEDRLLRVELDCGFPLETLITGSAQRELEIEEGRTYHVTFKATAVRLY